MLHGPAPFEASGWGGSRPGQPLQRGALLVATPALGDPNFRRTVVLVLEHEDEGSLGVVLNRPSTVAVGDVLEQWRPCADLAPPSVVFVGGPVSSATAVGLALVTGTADAGQVGPGAEVAPPRRGAPWSDGDAEVPMADQTAPVDDGEASDLVGGGMVVVIDDHSIGSGVSTTDSTGGRGVGSSGVEPPGGPGAERAGPGGPAAGRAESGGPAAGAARPGEPRPERAGWDDAASPSMTVRHLVVTVDLRSGPEVLSGVLPALAGSGQPGGVRVFAGYAGWGAGQLAAEIDAGAWWVLPARARDVLDAEPGTLWRRVLRRQPLPLGMLAAYPDDLAAN